MMEVKVTQLICKVILEMTIENNLKMTNGRVRHEWDNFVVAINLKLFLWFGIKL